MEPLSEGNILVVGILCFFGLLFAIGLLFFFVWKYGNLNSINSQEFEKLYERIEGMIKDLDISPENSKTILFWLDELDSLKHRDKEKRNELYDRFWAKFEAKASNIIKNHLSDTNKEVQQY